MCYGLKTQYCYQNFCLGYYNINPPKQRNIFTWDVSKVLNFLSTLMPVEEISLKMLTYKLVGLMALKSAARAQTLGSLDIRYMSKFLDKIVFFIQKVIKTSRPGVPLPKISFCKYKKPELCVLITLLEYLKRTSNLRKNNSLFISYKTHDKLPLPLYPDGWNKCYFLSGIKNFTAHSFKSTATSTAYAAGVSIKDIMETANWSQASTFYKFYHREVKNSNTFANSVLSNEW